MEVGWRVPRRVPVGKLIIAGLVAVATALSVTELWQWALAGAVVAVLAGWAARDLVAPVRLAADPAGVTVVTGFGNRHRLAWSRVERVRVDVRHRSKMLEVDAGDRLFVFSRYDVDDDLETIAGRLEALRTGRPDPAPER
ncbi:MAG TPA: PH domain-containing protein [Natronosporangium sp.]